VGGSAGTTPLACVCVLDRLAYGRRLVRAARGRVVSSTLIWMEGRRWRRASTRRESTRDQLGSRRPRLKNKLRPTRQCPGRRLHSPSPGRRAGCQVADRFGASRRDPGWMSGSMDADRVAASDQACDGQHRRGRGVIRGGRLRGRRAAGRCWPRWKHGGFDVDPRRICLVVSDWGVWIEHVTASAVWRAGMRRPLLGPR
jgi:hypothetical protein